MEKKVKLKLEELKVESFITALDKAEKETVNGGDWADSSYPCAIASAGGTIFYAVASESVKATISIGGYTLSTGMTASVATTYGVISTGSIATSVASAVSASVLTVSAASVGYTIGMSLNYSQEAISEYFTVDTSIGSAVSNGLSYLGGCSYWTIC